MTALRLLRREVVTIAGITGSNILSDKVADAVKFTKAFWLRLMGGQRSGLIKKIIDRFQTKGLNYKGEPFAGYSEKYAEAKAAGDKVKLGIVGQPQASHSTKPDMTLTGVLYRGLRPQTADDSSGTFGWEGPNAAKVEALHGRKNYQIIGLDGDKVLADEEEQFIVDEMEKQIGKKIDVWASKTVGISIGRK